MTMTAGWRKFALVAHVTASVGSLGAVAAFLLLAIVGLASEDAGTVRAVYIANAWIAWYAVVPLILAALLTGIVQSLGTPWGLFRHYWVLTKFLLTLATVYVLQHQLEGIDAMATLAAETALSEADFVQLRRSFLLHGAGGLVVLVGLVTLSIYKPRGMTRYGRKRAAVTSA